MSSIINRNYIFIFKHLPKYNLLLSSITTRHKSDFIPIFEKALIYNDRIGVEDQNGLFSYKSIYHYSRGISKNIAQFVDVGANERIAFLCPNDISHITTTWAIWMSGNVAVPLSLTHPRNILEYYIKDSKSKILIATHEHESVLAPIANDLDRKLLIIDKKMFRTVINQEENVDNMSLLEHDFYSSNTPALILYTSGTTGNPKGVVLSHTNLDSQVNSLTNAWQVNQDDSLLHVLPLNHVHGAVNGVMLPLKNGAKITMLPKFNSKQVWDLILHKNGKSDVNLFMAVPTIYNFLIAEYQKEFSKNIRLCEFIKVHCTSKIRLMISGSAPLPETVFTEWESITGHRLLERYGMTEIGMALSNAYIQDKTRERIPGTVGYPLPGVEARIVDTASTKVLFEGSGQYDKNVWSTSEAVKFSGAPKQQKITGDLYIRGPNVFTYYFEKPDATKQEFTDDGWFKTGDTVSIANGIFKIMGRTSIDIIKSGGYKISALEIENKLLDYPYIQDIAVVGLPDLTWGQKIAAVIVPKSEVTNIDVKELKDWCKTFMAPYTIPSIIRLVETIPRNAMGKINKKQLVEDMFSKYLK